VNRPSFEDINMRYALSLADRSTCLRGTKVGCVITSIDFRKVLAIGYNGNASKLPNKCDRTGAEAVGNCGCLHAEENAVINCDVSRETKKLVFCTHLPCVMCAKRLVNLGGVHRIHYLNDYRIRDSVELLKSVGIPVVPHILDPDYAPAWQKAETDLAAKPPPANTFTSPQFCDHANECPNICPCADDCYCKSNTCAPFVKVR
jgi:dCMP deaminase